MDAEAPLSLPQRSPLAGAPRRQIPVVTSDSSPEAEADAPEPSEQLPPEPSIPEANASEADAPEANAPEANVPGFTGYDRETQCIVRAIGAWQLCYASIITVGKRAAVVRDRHDGRLRAKHGDVLRGPRAREEELW